MSFSSGETYKITTSSNYEVEPLNLSESIIEDEIKIVKSSDVKDKLITLNDTIFQFDCTVENNNLILTFSEVDALSPFIYTINMTLKDIIKAHKIFKACDDLNEIQKFIISLFKKGKISLSQEKSEELILNIKVLNISFEDNFKIIAKRKMTENKDAMLLKLYSIQKNKQKLFKELESIFESDKSNGLELYQKFKEIQEKYKN